MLTIDQLKCSSCGAEISITNRDKRLGTCKCKYCGSDFVLPMELRQVPAREDLRNLVESKIDLFRDDDVLRIEIPPRGWNSPLVGCGILTVCVSGFFLLPGLTLLFSEPSNSGFCIVSGIILAIPFLILSVPFLKSFIIRIDKRDLKIIRKLSRFQNEKSYPTSSVQQVITGRIDKNGIPRTLLIMFGTKEERIGFSAKPGEADWIAAEINEFLQTSG